jgi:hypothetical protein
MTEELAATNINPSLIVELQGKDGTPLTPEFASKIVTGEKNLGKIINPTLQTTNMIEKPSLIDDFT